MIFYNQKYLNYISKLPRERFLILRRKIRMGAMEGASHPLNQVITGSDVNGIKHYTLFTELITVHLNFDSKITVL